MTHLTLSLDPACDWSWRTASWLNEVENKTANSFELKPLSLLTLYGDEINQDWVEMLTASHGALRIIEALRCSDNPDLARTFYSVLGREVHELGSPLNAETVRAAAEKAGVAEFAAAANEVGWDEQILAEHDAALASVGPDVGSPIVRFASSERGIYGPVLTEVPTGEEAVAVFEAIETLANSTGFSELKRSKS